MSELTPVKRALIALEKMKAKVEAYERARSEPIAIIGIGCRFPGGATDPATLWRLLEDRVDATSKVPADRWDADALFDADPDTPGKAYTRRGGFIDDPAGFDAAFFGISPREARSMDPQQRLLLEVCTEALEDGARAVDGRRASSTGVFIGLSGSDYSGRTMGAGLDRIDGFTGTGIAGSVAAGRIAYTLGLQGPCLALDTSCSSSLVALHLACQSLRSDECDLALAAGVNLMLAPESSVYFSKVRALAPDGRCKSFDDAADGYARGEGCGAVALVRLSDALERGDPIHALVLGSAVNHDGRSGGLTAPNGPAQQAVIRRALTAAGLSPDRVGYIEAHGTGTPLGDPIEIGALTAVFGERDRPLPVGSIKTNVGHLEAAAGHAGLIKAALVLEHNRVPASLHCTRPNHRVDWSATPVCVAMSASPLDGDAVGVSSFGFSGTNAHIVLGRAPVDATPVAVDAHDATQVACEFITLPISARSPSALTDLASRYADALASVSPADLAVTSGAGRVRHPHRAAVVAPSAELATKLRSLAAAQETVGVRSGHVPSGSTPRVAFLFTGQGSQYAGMGQSLQSTQPVFRDALERCAARARPGLLDRIASGEGLDQTEHTQPALFALGYALAELWRSLGVSPALVLGHSIGEITAACVAGAMSLDDGIDFVVERGALMQSLPSGGAMCAVHAPEALVREVAADVDIAAINGAESVVIAGPADAVERAAEQLAARDVHTRRLGVSHAFHSALMDPILGRLTDAATRIETQAPTVPLVLAESATVTDRAPTAAAWASHARATVRFDAALGAALDFGCDLLLEIGPRPTLIDLARRQAPDVTTVASLRPPRAGRADGFAQAVAELYCAGAPIDFDALHRTTGGRRVHVPTYPFQHRRFWIEAAPPARAPAPSRSNAFVDVLE